MSPIPEPPDASSVERDLAAYYDQEGPSRAERAIDAPRAEARDGFLQRLPASASPVLEIGIGPGRDAAAFVADGRSVVGVDLSFEHAHLATRTGALPVVASVRALPFRRGSFPVVWSMSTLMHVPDAAIDAALAEVARVLDGGGRAAVGVWGGPDVEEHAPSDAFDPPRFFSRRSDARWQALLGRVGSIDEYRTWSHLEGDLWYQWAVVQR